MIIAHLNILFRFFFIIYNFQKVTNLSKSYFIITNMIVKYFIVHFIKNHFIKLLTIFFNLKISLFIHTFINHYLFFKFLQS